MGHSLTLRYIDDTQADWSVEDVNQLSADDIGLHTQLSYKGQLFASLQHRRSENRVSYFAAVDNGTACSEARQLIVRIEYFISVPAPQLASSQADSLRIAVVRQKAIQCGQQARSRAG